MKRLSVFCLILVMSVLATACTSTAQTPSPTATQAPSVTDTPAQETQSQTITPLNPPEKVVVGYVAIMKFAPLYVAKERGIFEKYGLDVEVESVKSGTEIVAFLTEGKMDVGGIAIVASTWNSWAQGLNLQIIAPGGLEPQTNSPTKLLVRKDLVDNGQVTTIADLKGLVMATAGGPGSGGEYLASKALQRGNLTIGDVQLQNLANADMPPAFENKTIDAGLLASPYADQAINDGFAVAIAEDLTPGAMTVAFVASEQFINERPEVAQRFVLSLMEAARMMQGEDYLSPENIAAYLTFINTTEDNLKSTVPFTFDPNQKIETDWLSDIENIHRQNGRTEYTDPIDPATVVDTTFVNWALGVLGKYKAP